jgi:hypothetical protein
MVAVYRAGGLVRRVGGEAMTLLALGVAYLTWSASTLDVSGNPLTQPVTYRVFMGLKGQPKKFLKGNLTVLNLTVNGLPAGETTCFFVRAVSAGLVSAPSNTGCKFIPAT